MRHAWLLPVLVTAVTPLVVVTERPRASALDAPGSPAPRGVGAALAGLDPYVDPDFGFSVAVPSGWTPIVVPEDATAEDALEPGYAVAFESVPHEDGERFADYLMIEILPGAEAGLFETDGTRRRRALVDGRRAWRDELTLPPDPADARPVELVVRQASLSGLGYTIGFYAIGRSTRTPLIEDAFEAMLRSFHLPWRPFAVS